MKIKVIAAFKTKSGRVISRGEEFQTRRIFGGLALFDTTTPFQIIEGPFAGEEIPFKLALVLPDEPQPTQQQFDRLSQQNADLLDELEQINAAIGKYDGQLVDAVLQLVQDKSELLQTVERHTDEQLNTEKLLQRIRELETVANGRSEMIKSLQAELEEVRSTQQPVELPQDVVEALDSLKSSRHNAAQIVRLALDGINGPSESQALYSFTSSRTGLNELIYALVYGYTAAPENDELADEIDKLTEKWFYKVSASWSEDERSDLNKLIYDYLSDLDKTAV